MFSFSQLSCLSYHKCWLNFSNLSTLDLNDWHSSHFQPCLQLTILDPAHNSYTNRFWARNTNWSLYMFLGSEWRPENSAAVLFVFITTNNTNNRAADKAKWNNGGRFTWDRSSKFHIFNSIYNFNSIYGYQMFNNSVPEFVSNLFISVNSRYPWRDVFKLYPCNDIKINTSIAKSYPFLFAQWLDCPVLNVVYLNILSHLFSFFLLFSLLVWHCKTFCPKWFRLPNKVLKKSSLDSSFKTLARIKTKTLLCRMSLVYDVFHNGVFKPKSVLQNHPSTNDGL